MSYCQESKEGTFELSLIHSFPSMESRILSSLLAITKTEQIFVDVGGPLIYTGKQSLHTYAFLGGIEGLNNVLQMQCCVLHPFLRARMILVDPFSPCILQLGSKFLCDDLVLYLDVKSI